MNLYIYIYKSTFLNAKKNPSFLFILFYFFFLFNFDFLVFMKSFFFNIPNIAFATPHTYYSWPVTAFVCNIRIISYRSAGLKSLWCWIFYLLWLDLNTIGYWTHMWIEKLWSIYAVKKIDIFFTNIIRHLLNHSCWRIFILYMKKMFGPLMTFLIYI